MHGNTLKSISVAGFVLSIMFAAGCRGKDAEMPLDSTPVVSCDLVWSEEPGNRVLFDANDIERFDWDKQVFELTLAKASELLALRQANWTRFFALSGRESLIYRGIFTSMESSIEYDGPAIVWESAPAPLFKIDAGYPTAAPGKDVRFSEHLKQALGGEGLLGEIDLSEAREPMQVLSSVWTEKEGLKFRVWLFPQTFRIGQEAVVCVFVKGDHRHKGPSVTMQLTAVMESKESEFGCCYMRDVELGKAIDDGVHIFKHRPWGPIYSSLEPYASPGPASFGISVSVYRKTQVGPQSWRGSPLLKVGEIGTFEFDILPGLENTEVENMTQHKTGS
jgi:hypothetical protein